MYTPLRDGSLSLSPSQARVSPDGAQSAQAVKRSGSGMGNPWTLPVERSMSATPVVQSGGFRQSRKDSWLPSGDQCGNSPGRTRVGSPPLGSTAYRSRLSSPANSWSNTMSSPAPSGDAAAAVAAEDAEDDAAAVLDTLVAGADRSWSSDALPHPVSPRAATTTASAVQARASNHCLCHVEGAAPFGAVGMVAPFTTRPTNSPSAGPPREPSPLKQSTPRQTEQRPLPATSARMSDEVPKPHTG